jgi:hypothetical protein
VGTPARVAKRHGQPVDEALPAMSALLGAQRGELEA